MFNNFCFPGNFRFLFRQACYIISNPFDVQDMYFRYYPIYIIFSISLAVSKFDTVIFFCPNMPSAYQMKIIFNLLLLLDKNGMMYTRFKFYFLYKVNAYEETILFTFHNAVAIYQLINRLWQQ